MKLALWAYLAFLLGMLYLYPGDCYDPYTGTYEAHTDTCVGCTDDCLEPMED